MSGTAPHDLDLLNPEYKIHDIEIIKATPESFKDYGNFVYDFQSEKVEIVPWPLNGTRKLHPGTGIGGGEIEGENRYVYNNDTDGLKKLFAHNMAVKDFNNKYITGLVDLDNLSGFKKKEDNSIFSTTILLRECNYHPDGGQVFYPLEKKPFIAVLALPGDDVKPENFVGFYFEGDHGLQIKPNIWHFPMYPIYKYDSLNFIGKQGKVHGCVCVDFIEEFNVVLRLQI